MQRISEWSSRNLKGVFWASAMMTNCIFTELQCSAPFLMRTGGAALEPSLFDSFILQSTSNMRYGSMWMTFDVSTNGYSSHHCSIRVDFAPTVRSSHQLEEMHPGQRGNMDRLVFQFSLGTTSLDMQKRSKLLKLIQALESQKHIHKRDIEPFLGLAVWVTQLFPGMRPLLQDFYADLFSAPASLYSIDPGAWPNLANHLDNNLRFTSTPPGTGIPIGGLLVSVRHQSVTKKSVREKYLVAHSQSLLEQTDYQFFHICDQCFRNLSGQVFQQLTLVCLDPPCKWVDLLKTINNTSGSPNSLKSMTSSNLVFLRVLKHRKTLLAMRR